MAKIDLGLIRGSMWYQGTKITGQNTEGVIFPETGISEALKGDKYQNSETNDLYECVKGGAADIAQWKWYGNISFGDISDRAVTYELPDTVDMSQIPASGGLLKNFVGWIFNSIFSLNSAVESTKMKSKEYNIKNVTISANNYILYRVNPGFNIRFVTVMGISGVITNTPFIYGVYDYIVIVAPNGTNYTEIQLLLWH